jgi:hypothetical protein
VFLPPTLLRTIAQQSHCCVPYPSSFVVRPCVSAEHWTSFETASSVLPRLNETELLDEDTCPDLGEQLRAVFLRLKQRCAQLPKLSEPRSFMIGMEPKDDAKDSPWQDPWIMVEHSTGKTGKKTVPIYSVQDKWLCFDVWVRNLQKLEQGE